MSILPLLLTDVNFGVKAEVYPEKRYIPQVTLGINYFNFVVLGIDPIKENVDASCSGYDLGLTLAKKMGKNIRLFYGTRYIKSDLKLKLNEPIEITEEMQFSELNTGVNGTALCTGAIYGRGKKKFIMETGYEFTHKKIFTKVLISSGLVEYGFGLYPESLLVFRPCFSFHLRF